MEVYCVAGVNEPCVPNHLDQPPTVIVTLNHDSFTTDQFRKLWRRGAPIVVQNVHTDFQGRWTPSHFIREYGSRSVQLIDCATGITSRSSVAAFFSQMTAPELSPNVMKLKACSVFYGLLKAELSVRLPRIGLYKSTSAPSSLNCSTHFLPVVLVQTSLVATAYLIWLLIIPTTAMFPQI